jgi:hypothetical protein
VRVIGAGVVADEDVVDAVDERLGEPVQDLRQGRRGVVGDDEDADALGRDGRACMSWGEHR